MTEHYYRLRDLADASETRRNTGFIGIDLSSTADTALFILFAGIVSIIFILYGLSFIQCFRMMLCPETVRRRRQNTMIQQAGMYNLDKKQRRALVDAFFYVKSVNVINVSESNCSHEDGIDNQCTSSVTDNKKVVVVFMNDDDDDDDDIKMKGEMPSSLELCEAVENSEITLETSTESIREKLSRALGCRAPSSLSQLQHGQEDTLSEVEIAPEINHNNIAAIDTEGDVLNVEIESTSAKNTSWWKSLFLRKKAEEDECSEESEDSVSAIELHNDCYGSNNNDADCKTTCAICLAEYETGDLVINSKMCDHLFHKDCLLEWLEKNDKCPYCRVDMIPSCLMHAVAATNFSRSRAS